MKVIRVIFGLIVLTLCAGCDSGASMAKMKKAQKLVRDNATAHISVVREAHALFPEARVRLYTHKFTRESTAIDIEEIVYDRYRFGMQIQNIEVDSKYSIVDHGTPLIKLTEVTLVEVSSNGQLGYSSGTDYTISLEQWRKIVAARGDFKAAGLDVITNEPVAGIEILKTKAHTPEIGEED